MTEAEFKAADLLKKGGVVVLPTDTIYGLTGSALSPETIERLYRLKKRNPLKPFLILISDETDLGRFGIKPRPAEKKLLASVWPGPVSVILSCGAGGFDYLHRGTRTVAFRLPEKAPLRGLLKMTGPLAAPSANPEGLPPARNVSEARAYFGDQVDFYVDGGFLTGAPSKIVKISGGKFVIIRPTDSSA